MVPGYTLYITVHYTVSGKVGGAECYQLEFRTLQCVDNLDNSSAGSKYNMEKYTLNIGFIRIFNFSQLLPVVKILFF